jgi:phosphonate transport system substrate-binding protein
MVANFLTASIENGRARKTTMRPRPLSFSIALAVLIGLGALLPEPSFGQSCKHRGHLEIGCDDNNDLVADAPADPQKWKDPATLLFAMPTSEDPAIYLRVIQPFLAHLGQCTGKRVQFHHLHSNAAQIEAMRTGRLHIAGFSTGPTGFAVNLAGAVPFAIKGTKDSPQGYHLLALVRTDSPYHKLADLKGKRVAHTSRSSYSGNIAPRVLFPPEGLTPDVDYAPVLSGGHDKSTLGVVSTQYDMAPVASSVLARMRGRDLFKDEELRVIYESPLFPTSSFTHAHDLKPDLAKKIRECFYAFHFTSGMSEEFHADRFLPITYKQHWAVVREIAEKTGAPFNRAAYDIEMKRETETSGKARSTATP